MQKRCWMETTNHLKMTKLTSLVSVQFSYASVKTYLCTIKQQRMLYFHVSQRLSKEQRSTYFSSTCLYIWMPATTLSETRSFQREQTSPAVSFCAVIQTDLICGQKQKPRTKRSLPHPGLSRGYRDRDRRGAGWWRSSGTRGTARRTEQNKTDECLNMREDKKQGKQRKSFVEG